jgi:hypothetical protein
VFQLSSGLEFQIEIGNSIPISRYASRQSFRGMLRPHELMGAAAQMIRGRRVTANSHLITTACEQQEAKNPDPPHIDPVSAK